MLYLEDYLEMIEHLPQELRDRFTEMREMDLQVHNAMDNLEEQSKQFFGNAKNMKTEQRDIEYDRIKQDYYKTLEDAEEKVSIANQIYELVDKYLRRLDQELQKFKIELEADNAGITEVLERRSLELDNPPPVAVNHVREKRKYTFHNNNVNTNNTPYSTPHPERPQLASTSEKLLSTITQEVYRGSTPNTPLSAGVITSSNITSNRLNANAFTPLLAVVNANNANHPNGNNPPLSSPLIPSNSSVSVPEKGSASTGPLPHGSFRCNLGNTAIAAAASQAIAATQQMQMGRRTASLKASYEAINSGFNNIYNFNPLRDHSINNSSTLEPMSRSTNPLGYGYELPGNKAGQSGNRTHKRSRTSQYGSDTASNSHISVNFEDNSSEALNSDNNGAPDWTYDPNEPRYCICNNVSYGEMIACDNEDCQKEWFHYGCVGITQSPKGKWYCPDCSDKLNKRKRKERTQT